MRTNNIFFLPSY